MGMVVRASAEDQETAVLPDVADQPVSVPVSPSDVLTMFFQVVVCLVASFYHSTFTQMSKMYNTYTCFQEY